MKNDFILRAMQKLADVTNDPFDESQIALRRDFFVPARLRMPPAKVLRVRSPEETLATFVHG
jgi:hypothetical protein